MCEVDHVYPDRVGRRAEWRQVMPTLTWRFFVWELLERVASGFKLAVDKLVDNIEDRWTGPVVKNRAFIGIELAQNEVGVADLAAQ